mmetsp:Transcript_43961/g.125333  ORF Transcript_43961/g.125333 Transcript_43961/m.125333 type:complete len:211 (-) Transcript_43961:2844-3476(-)
MSNTPFTFSSKPNLGSTPLCTVRASFWSSTLNLGDSFPWASSSSTRRLWKSSAAKPAERSLCSLKACSRVSVGNTPSAGLRSSTPRKSRLLRAPRASLSSRDLKPPASPAFLTSRPFCATAALRSFVASISLTCRMVDVVGTKTCTASPVIACFTVISTSGGSSGVSCASCGCSGASTSLSSTLSSNPFLWNSSSPSKAANAFIMATTPA